MEFELAYELEIEVDNEVVFVRSADWHRKVRLWITDVTPNGDSITFSGNSLGSSVKEIKAAKKDETPVRVNGKFDRVDGILKGTLEVVR